MTQMSKGRQVSPHLRLTPDEVKKLWNEGHYTPKGYLYHLILAHRKPGWPWKIDNVSQFCREWGFARSTFYKAKAALVSEGLIDENIIGSFELTAFSTDKPKLVSANACTQLETGVSDGRQGVSDGRQGVSDGRQGVSDGRHMEPEALSQQESYDPTDLYNSFTTTYTQGVSVENSVLDPEVVQKVVDDFDNGSTEITQVPSSSNIENEATVPEKDQYSAPPILAATKKYGVNVDDPKLREAIEKFPERVERAIQCLDEKQLTVKSPTRFLCAAIEQDWRPEKNVAPSEWGTWFNEAQKRGLVTASQQVNDVIQVLTRDGQWVPYETLRRLNWEELQSQLNPAPEFVSETIKSISTHPDHGKVLEVPAVAVAPSSPKPSGDRPPSPRPKSPQDIAAKIKALGEAKSCP